MELTGSSDPLRVTARHALSLQQRTLTVTLDVYNRLPVDIRNAFIRCELYAELQGANQNSINQQRAYSQWAVSGLG